jgi:predicted kinase
MTAAKVILLTGFGASGKTTIAKRYVQDHELAMMIEADYLVNNIGQWRSHKSEIRGLLLELIMAMCRTYLQRGHDVILPYLVEDAREIEALELVARDCEARFYEIELARERSKAIDQLLKRGRWGLADAEPLGEKDRPEIEKSMDNFEAALSRRPHLVKVPLDGLSPDETYRKLLELVV